MTDAPVLVAVRPDGTDEAAVVWAAEEAVRRRTSLLVTAVPTRDVPGPAVRRCVGGAVDLAILREPGLAVRADRSGAPGYRHLLALSDRAVLLVLGGVAEPHARVDAAPIAEQLTVHARCPVVVLSPQAGSVVRPRHGVVAGWAPGRSGREALVVAAAEAAARAAWLTVVSVPLPDDPLVDRTLGRPDRESDLLMAVAAAERANAGLVVDVLHRKGTVSDELIKVAGRAELLVIGCHHSRQPWSNRPGAIASRLMRSAPCPLMLVGAAAPHRPDLATTDQRELPARATDRHVHQLS